MWPPLEWVQRFGAALEAADPDVWHMVASIYGRETAGANFRDDFERSMKLLPGVASITRGLIEPALYRATSAAGATCGLVTHHIDDGRAIAPTAQALEDLLKHLARYFVLKRSTIQ